MAIKQWLRWLRSHFLDFRVGLVPKGLIHGYIGRALEQHGLPVYSHVIYLRPDATIAASTGKTGRAIAW